MPYRLRKSVTTLGRDPYCDLAIDTAFVQVSRQHAQIHRKGQYFVLVDNNSMHGTYVNNERIRQKTLQDGDRISLGNQANLTFWKNSIYTDKEVPRAPLPTQAVQYVPPAQQIAVPGVSPLVVVVQGSPYQSKWSTGTMVGLMATTVLIPLVGLIAGIIGLTKDGKQGQGVLLILWAIMCMGLNYTFLMRLL